MGREVRRVPKNWKHPKDKNGIYIPLFNGTGFAEKCKDWDEEKKAWKKGFRKDFCTKKWIKIEDKNLKYSYEEWNGEKPDKKNYMPEWSEKEKTHLQMYEDCTEGMPISPVLETPEELAIWLVDNKISACGKQTATYEGWLKVCKGEYAPSIILNDNKIFSGVDGLLL